MAYDEELADRIRELLSDRGDMSEQKMFGGLGFLVGGNMAIAASGEGGILVRADPAESDKLVRSGGAETAVMRGRPMAGWLRVAAGALRTKRQLEKWVKVGTAYAGSLPAKGGPKGGAKGPTQAKAAAKSSAKARTETPAETPAKRPAKALAKRPPKRPPK